VAELNHCCLIHGSLAAYSIGDLGSTELLPVAGELIIMLLQGPENGRGNTNSIDSLKFQLFLF